MATKRSHGDVDGEGYESGSPGPTMGNDNAGPSAKKRKFSGKKHKAKEGTLEYSKKRARTIQRLFQRNQDLPADVRNDMERELAAHQAAVADKTFQKRRTAMISKYHMVRFFERKKAIRHAKQVKSKMSKTSDPEELQKLQQELHVAEVDEAYTLNYPHAETYLSLYGKPKEGKEDGDEGPSAKAGEEAERPPMWTTVEKAMEEGPEALKALRERRSPDESADKPKSRKISSKTQQAKNPKPTQPIKSTNPAPSRPAPLPTGKHSKDAKQPRNRRERRKLMRELAPPANKSEDEDDGEGFFEGV